MTNKGNTTLYIGVTSHLRIRIWQHKTGENNTNFTARYNCHKLVYYKFYPSIEEAILIEKRLKNWHRDWKINLITERNPNWMDLWDEIKDDD